MSERKRGRWAVVLRGALVSTAAGLSLVALSGTSGGCVSSGCTSSEPPAAASPDAASPAASTGAREARGPAGTPGGQPVAAPAEGASAAAGQAPEEIRLAPDDSQPPLPDGTFTGRFQGDEAAVSVRLVVRDGMVLRAHVEVVGKRRTSLELQPVVAADARTLRFQGRFGADYLRLKGRFVDDRRAAGTFQGQVDRKRVSGRWYALRR